MEKERNEYIVYLPDGTTNTLMGFDDESAIESAKLDKAVKLTRWVEQEIKLTK